MKRIILVFLFFVVGCTYLTRKNVNFSDVSLSYETRSKKGVSYLDSVMRNACQQTYILFLDMLAYKPNSISFYDEIETKCFSYAYGFKPKVGEKIEGEYSVSYKFNFNINKMVSDLKEKEAFNDNRPYLLFLTDEKIYEFKDNLSLNFAKVDFKIKSEKYDLKKYDFIVDSTLLNSEIKTSVSSLYFSSITAKVVNSYSSSEIAVVKAESVSQISADDSIKNIISELSMKFVEKKDIFSSKYYTINIHKWNKYSYLKDVLKVLKDNNFKFYVDSLSSDLLSLRIYKKDLRTLQEIASVFVKDIKNISVDVIDEGNAVIILYFVDSRLNII